MASSPKFFFVNCDPGFVAGVYEALRNFRVVTKRRATSLHLAKALRNGCNQPLGGVAVFAAHVEVEVDREEQRYGCDAKHVCDPLASVCKPSSEYLLKGRVLNVF